MRWLQTYYPNASRALCRQTRRGRLSITADIGGAIQAFAGRGIDMVVSKAIRAPSDEQDICQSHHWVIAAPHGPTSKGVCRKCSEVREFRNSIPDDYESIRSRRESPVAER